jgi:hypothetical protein
MSLAVFSIYSGRSAAKATERVPDFTIMTVMTLSSIYLLLRTRGKVIFPLTASENALDCLMIYALFAALCIRMTMYGGYLSTFSIGQVATTSG